MIVFPNNWNQDYSKYDISCELKHITEDDLKTEADNIIELLKHTLKQINVNHLAFNGDIESTVVLILMKRIFKEVFTYTIYDEYCTDKLFTRTIANSIGSHHRNICIPFEQSKNKPKLYNKELCDILRDEEYTSQIIFCQGVDEFMCGTAEYRKSPRKCYDKYLGQLQNKLNILHGETEETKVYLPYLESNIINLFTQIPLKYKVDKKYPKKIMLLVGKRLGLSDEIIFHNYL